MLVCSDFPLVGCRESYAIRNKEKMEEIRNVWSQSCAEIRVLGAEESLSEVEEQIAFFFSAQSVGLYQNETSMLFIDIKPVFFHVLSDVSHTWFSSLDLDLDSDLD